MLPLVDGILTIVEMKFGSHLYGTSTPASDLDIKAVHIPDGRDILLQRAKPVITRKTKEDGSAKNSSDDTDFESYSLHKYLKLVAEGQTVALDMLFAPESAFITPIHNLWRGIQMNRHRLLTNRYASFVGYCRTQANKYGIRGSRVAAARSALWLLERSMEEYGTTKPLSEAQLEIDALVKMTEHMSIIDIDSPGFRVVRHWEVCGRKMPWTASIKSAHSVMGKLVSEYGQRALAAEQNNGVDWKAMSHAVRIGHQAIEVLSTGNVAFPRPDADHLLDIKLGRLEYGPVADEIERLLEGIETAAAKSTLPDEPDYEWIDEFVARAYEDAIASQVRASLR